MSPRTSPSTRSPFLTTHFHPRLSCQTRPSRTLTLNTTDLSHLRLKYLASSGRLSDVFHATLDQNAVVIKLVDLESFTLSGEPDQYSLDEARTAVTRELDLYLGPLRELQPRFVPRCHGVCVGETRQPWTGRSSVTPSVIALVLDDVGEPIAEDWHTIPQELR